MNLAACASLPWGPETGTWYRAIQPQHQSTALQTSQSLLQPSRFSAGPLAIRPFETLHVAENSLVAHLEVSATVGSLFQPHTLISPGRQNWLTYHVEVRLQRVVDLADPSVQAQLHTSEQELTGAWESYSYRIPGAPPRGLAPTQELGQALHDTPGLEGFLAVSAKAPLYKTLVIFPRKLLQHSHVITTISGVGHRLDGTLAPP